MSVIGTRLNHYEIRSLLGAGGMGEVYLAQDTQLDRQVALKILPEHLASDEQRMRRFVQEARAASSLNHPNIITIHEVGKSGSAHFIATEFIDGMTLRQLVNNRRMTLREIFDIVIQIASALTSAHAAGIVHRDIKPENIMLRSDGYIKVLDFGLAKLAEEAEEAGAHRPSDPDAPTKTTIKTDPGIVLGTALYMSPEQARGLAVDARTDLWSFGVVLFEMITKRKPFGGATPSDIIAAILEREPPQLARYVPNVPAELERIVSKTLAKDTEERYQTAKDLLIDLRRLKRQLDVEVELERAIGAGADGKETTSDNAQVATDTDTASDSTADTMPLDVKRTTSSAEYLIDEIKRHKRGMLAGLIVLIAIAASVGYLLYERNKAISSIVVLPFVNATRDSGMDGLCDGITESVINDLSQRQGLIVLSRSTSFNYKGQTIEPQKIGDSLGVRAVLTGRVSKSGTTLVVSAELIDVTNNAQLWGGYIKNDQADLIGGASFLPLQEDMAKQILGRLKAKLPDDGLK